MALLIDKIKEKFYIDTSGTKKDLLFLYTKGKEFFLNGKEYIGEYHYEGTTAYVGPEPEIPALKLGPYYSDLTIYRFDTLSTETPKQYTPPVNDYIEPSPGEIKAGKMNRYFVIRTNDKQFNLIEISKDSYGKIGTPGGIDPALYSSIVIPWIITSNKFKLRETYQNNLDMVTLLSKQIPNLKSYILDYTKFSLI